MIKVHHRRFVPNSHNRALVLLAQAECPMEIDASLNALRDECLHHLGSGKKVLIQ